MTELDDDARARLALIASPEALAATGLEIEDLTDPDARSVAIRADHSELDEALADGRDHVTVAGEPMNIRLHLAMHEVVAKQLADDEPPEVYETAGRLLDAGYDRHEVLHMLARSIASQIRANLTDKQPYDHARHVAALRALPASWEPERAQRKLESAHRHLTWAITRWYQIGRRADGRLRASLGEIAYALYGQREGGMQYALIRQALDQPLRRKPSI